MRDPIRSDHTAILLLNGSVLIVDGAAGAGLDPYCASAELFK